MDFVSSLKEVVMSNLMTVLYSTLIAALVLGVCAAIKEKVFTIGGFGKIVPDKVFPAIVWIVVATLVGISSTWGGISDLVYAGVMALYVKGILGSIKALTGLDIPEPLSK